VGSEPIDHHDGRAAMTSRPPLRLALLSHVASC
jgi:hypothetical protein